MEKRSKVLLSVDWDFFFPVPEHDPHGVYDWSMNESAQMFYDKIWTIRAADILQFQPELPAASGEEKTFWQRFTFAPGATLFFAESHKDIMKPVVMNGVGKVLNFDAHHDAGYDGEVDELRCDNWIQHLPEGVGAEVTYPYWKFYAKKHEAGPLVRVRRRIDDHRPCRAVIDRIFLCRSGAWVPGWLDDDFDSFTDLCPAGRKIQVAPLREREWDGGEAREMKRVFDEMIKEMNGKKFAKFKEEISIEVQAIKEEAGA